MSNYHFDLKQNGFCIEDLGGVILSSDADAIAFGGRVIQELLDKNPEQHARWIMRITEGGRVVRNIPLELG